MAAERVALTGLEEVIPIVRNELYSGGKLATEVQVLMALANKIRGLLSVVSVRFADRIFEILLLKIAQMSAAMKMGFIRYLGWIASDLENGNIEVADFSSFEMLWFLIKRAEDIFFQAIGEGREALTNAEKTMSNLIVAGATRRIVASALLTIGATGLGKVISHRKEIFAAIRKGKRATGTNKQRLLVTIKAFNEIKGMKLSKRDYGLMLGVFLTIFGFMPNMVIKPGMIGAVGRQEETLLYASSSSGTSGTSIGSWPSVYRSRAASETF